MLSFFGLSDCGCIRTQNEDRILTDSTRNLFLVADGMGGQQRGEVAAEMALAAISEYLQTSNEEHPSWPFGHDPAISVTRNLLINAIGLANQRIWEKSASSADHAGMGCTVVALMVRGNVATIGSVGDSRVYLYRRDRIRALTHDDSLVAKLVETGQIKSNEAESHPMRNVLLQAVGSRDQVKPQTLDEVLQDGDRLLLSSDGLHGVIHDSTIGRILGHPRTAEQTAANLIAVARDRGGPDNISAIVMDYTAV